MFVLDAWEDLSKFFQILGYPRIFATTVVLLFFLCHLSICFMFFCCTLFLFLTLFSLNDCYLLYKRNLPMTIYVFLCVYYISNTYLVSYILVSLPTLQSYFQHAPFHFFQVIFSLCRCVSAKLAQIHYHSNKKLL